MWAYIYIYIYIYIGAVRFLVEVQNSHRSPHRSSSVCPYSRRSPRQILVERLGNSRIGSAPVGFIGVSQILNRPGLDYLVLYYWTHASTDILSLSNIGSNKHSSGTQAYKKQIYLFIGQVNRPVSSEHLLIYYFKKVYGKYKKLSISFLYIYIYIFSYKKFLKILSKPMSLGYLLIFPLFIYSNSY